MSTTLSEFASVAAAAAVVAVVVVVVVAAEVVATAAVVVVVVAVMSLESCGSSKFFGWKKFLERKKLASNLRPQQKSL